MRNLQLEKFTLSVCCNLGKYKLERFLKKSFKKKKKGTITVRILGNEPWKNL